MSKILLSDGRQVVSETSLSEVIYYDNETEMMQYVSAKTIVRPVKHGSSWFGHNYNMNIYRGCSHGCIYCDSRSDCYCIEGFDEVRAKEDCLNVIENDLKRKRNKGVVGTGAMSDPYNPHEKELELTRGAMILLDKYGFGASITTKSSLIARDIDIFKRIRKHSPMVINVTVTTYDDELCRKIEPNVSVTSERFRAIRQLSDAGIFTGILMMPILPFVNDTLDNMLSIVRKAKECGARFIFPFFGTTTRAGSREWYLRKLGEISPDARNKHVSMYGDAYECPSPNHDELQKAFRAECDELGIIYRMDKIIEEYKTLFKFQSTLSDY